MIEFFRGPQWTSDGDRIEWEPKIRQAAELWNELEALSVTAGIRHSALFSVTPEELTEMSSAAAHQGLEISVLATQPLAPDYSASTPSSGAPGLRVALHTQGMGPEWHKAWTGSDDKLIGQLLGFPPCCIEFFEKTWVEDRKRDTTLSMATVDGPASANILLVGS